MINVAVYQPKREQTRGQAQVDVGKKGDYYGRV